MAGTHQRAAQLQWTEWLGFLRPTLRRPAPRIAHLDRQELIAFSRKPGNAPTNVPGAERGYSSTGYILLEMIAEKAEHRPLPDLYQHFIFLPNHMARTGVEGQGLRGAAIAPSYGRPDSTMEPFNAFGTRRPVRADGLVNLSD
ncbi:MAG TPA: serine hydrolase, partial [Sphingomicrobium sp.]|nr:serine hydrolase [Sphingomicrobium sp.]